MRLVDRVAVVTGGSRGIGAGIALRLAAEGATVAVNYARGREAAEGVVAQIRSNGGTATAIPCDLSRVEDIPGLFTQVAGEFGRVDILVNNAGWADWATLEQMTPEHYAAQFDLNVRAPLFASQAAIHYMGTGGRIINISSSITRNPGPASAVYTATKAALNAITEVLAQELGPRGITVNAVAPGVTETDLLRGAISAEALEPMIARTPLRRLGQPADIASVVAFLASTDADWITGEVIPASGGLR